MKSYSQQVEIVMQVFSRFSDKCIQDLDPPEYNKVYSWIAKCLVDFSLDKSQLQAENATLQQQVADWHKLADERSAEIGRLNERLARLVRVAENTKEELEYDMTNGNVVIDILKQAITAAKQGKCIM
jgi:hypothetical protein